MFAADAELDRRGGSSGRRDGLLHEGADSFPIQHREGIGFQNVGRLVEIDESSRHRHGRIRTSFVSGRSSQRRKTRPPPQCDRPSRRRAAVRSWCRPDRRVSRCTASSSPVATSRMRSFCAFISETIPTRRNHDLRDDLLPFLRQFTRGFHDGPRLHARNLRHGNPEPAAAQTQHGIELVEFFHPRQQSASFLRAWRRRRRSIPAARSPPSTLHASAGIRAAADRAAEW